MKNIDIDYGEIIKRSWQLTWKNKWLWVLGLVLAVFGGGSYGGSGSFGGSGSSKINLPSASPGPANNSIQNQTSYVLGEATNVLKSWFAGIPVGNWILLVLLILILVIFTAVIFWVLTSWAKGSLIAGFDEADNNHEVTLVSASRLGITKIKSLIILGIISFFIGVGVVLGLVLIFSFGFLIRIAIPVLGILWLILFGIVAFLVFMISIFVFTMVAIYAERLIVLKNYSPWNAWKKGFSLSKGNFLPTLLMGVINSVIGCASGCLGLIALLIVFIIPAILLIYPMFSHGFHTPSFIQIIGLVILVILFFSISTLIRAVFLVFDYGNWNLFFKQILEKTEDGK